MVDPVLLVAFVATVTLLVLTPGPDMLLIIAVGARGGPRAGVAAAVGVAAGLAVHAAAAAFGLVALFQLVPLTYDIVRVIGAGYLLYLGISTLRDRHTDGLGPPPPDPPASESAADPAWTPGRAFTRGLLTNLLNPKVVLFNAALLPQFVDPALGSTTVQLLVLGACFVLVDLLIDGPIGLLAGRLRGWLRRHRGAQRGLTLGSGSIFIGLSARLAFDSR